eukprot:COSAG01_NODE_2069_length_8498_cov_5.965841_4_plen_105_part_00
MGCRRWLENPSARSKLSRKLRTKKPIEQQRRTARGNSHANTVRRPAGCYDLEVGEQERFEDSIEEYIELHPDDQVHATLPLVGTIMATATHFSACSLGVCRDRH